MKKRVILFCLFAFLFLPVFAQEHPPLAKKYYCSAQQIELTDSVILVHMNGNTFEVDSILVDQGGIYFTEDRLRCINCRRPLNPKNTCECPVGPS
jgi:hypothetical protein